MSNFDYLLQFITFLPHFTHIGIWQRLLELFRLHCLNFYRIQRKIHVVVNTEALDSVRPVVFQFLFHA